MLSLTEQTTLYQLSEIGISSLSFPIVQEDDASVPGNDFGIIVIACTIFVFLFAEYGISLYDTFVWVLYMVNEGTAYTNWNKAWPWFSTISFVLAFHILFDIVFWIVYAALVPEDWFKSEETLWVYFIVVTAIQGAYFILSLTKSILIFIELLEGFDIFDIEGAGHQHLWELGPNIITMLCSASTIILIWTSILIEIETVMKLLGIPWSVYTYG